MKLKAFLFWLVISAIAGALTGKATAPYYWAWRESRIKPDPKMAVQYTCLYEPMGSGLFWFSDGRVGFIPRHVEADELKWIYAGFEPIKGSERK